jgi:Uma2 family endonuclease
MAALPNVDSPMSEDEYLAFERESEFKHQFFDGEIYAMSGASPEHNLIVGNTLATLHSQRRGKPCKVYPSDMKVHTPSTGSYAYPDVTVVCGEDRFDEDKGDVLLNPTVIVEVLSPSTEAFDRGMKFQRYREIESLQEYILIAQDKPHVERFLRQENGLWQFSDARGLDASLDLPSIGCKLALAEVYEQVDFDAEDRPEE